MGKLKIIYLAILNRGKKMIKKEDIQQAIHQMETLKGEVEEETKLAKKEEDED